MSQVAFSMESIKEFCHRLEQVAQGDFKHEIILFLEGSGLEFLRIVEDEIMRRKVLDTRLLLISVHKGEGGNVWVFDEAGLTLEVGTNVQYAAYVNDGHWTNKKGVERRFVPGVWEGDRFIYDPSAKTGMVLHQKWIEGAHFWESAIRIMERIFPKMLDTKMQDWLEKYFE